MRGTARPEQGNAECFEEILRNLAAKVDEQRLPYKRDVLNRFYRTTILKNSPVVTPMCLMIVACANVLYEMIPEIGEITRADHCSKEEIV